MQPIGPAPVTSTSSPSTGKVSAVWTALPNGSKIAATSSSMPGQWCQMFVIGSATYSANAPGRCTPSPIEWAHRCRRPAMQFRQRPQTTCPSPLTMSPTWKSLTLEPTSTISPTNSWPIDHRHRDRLLRPGVPRVDVEVGAADAGLAHADQDVVDPDLRLGDVLEPEARLGPRFDERLHDSAITLPGFMIPFGSKSCLMPR